METQQHCPLLCCNQPNLATSKARHYGCHALKRVITVHRLPAPFAPHLAKHSFASFLQPLFMRDASAKHLCTVPYTGSASHLRHFTFPSGSFRGVIDDGYFLAGYRTADPRWVSFQSLALPFNDKMLKCNCPTVSDFAPTMKTLYPRSSTHLVSHSFSFTIFKFSSIVWSFKR